VAGVLVLLDHEELLQRSTQHVMSVAMSRPELQVRWHF
jgi:hypothetical protein